MTATAITHLNFTGQARAALERYAEVFGGQAAIRTYAEVGMPADAHGADAVVWGRVFSPSGFTVMAYDVPGATGGDIPAAKTRRENGATITDAPFFVSLTASTIDEADGWFAALVDGGQVVEPLAASAWSPGFGMVTDRFGVTWAFTVDDGSAAG